MSNKGRKPDQGEMTLWERVMHGVLPMHRRDKVEPADDHLRPLPPALPKAVKNPVSTVVRQHRQEAVKSPAQPPQLDKRTEEKLRKGQFPIEGVLDMHGMTQVEAHQALNGFVTRAFQAQKRCILVITGKGTRSTVEGGLLRSQLPVWLSVAPLNDFVLRHVPAKGKHGGNGAFYLYLRRMRP